MYAYIKGSYTSDFSEGIIVENNGIGYLIYTPTKPQLPKNSEIKVYTYLHIREDSQTLFGFYSIEQKNLFEILITVNGIGPKLGLAILASLKPEEFAFAILKANIKTLTSVKGVGKKVAERLVVELKDKLKQADTIDAVDSLVVINDDVELNEVVEALCVLGYTKNLAYNVVQKTYDKSLDINDNIRKALQGLDRG